MKNKIAVNENQIIPVTFVLYELINYIYNSYLNKCEKCKVLFFYKEQFLGISIDSNIPVEIDFSNTSMELVKIFIKQLNSELEYQTKNMETIFKFKLKEV